MEIKKGDWVEVTESYVSNAAQVGKRGLVIQIDIESNGKYLILLDECGSKSWCINARLVNTEELKYEIY